MHNLIQGNIAVAAMGNFCVVSRKKRRRHDSFVVTFIHRTDQIFQIDSRCILAASIDAAKAVGLSNGVKELLFSFYYGVGRVEVLARGDYIVGRIYFSLVLDVVEQVVHAEFCCLVRSNPVIVLRVVSRHRAVQDEREFESTGLHASF